jgi:NADPH2:quinone reductase
MKAALYDRMGPARDVLKVTGIERPEPGPGQVRVRVLVSAINPTDVKARSGAVPRPIDGFQIPHQDGAGVIDAVGDGVDPARVGQRVWLFLAAAGRRWGTAAEWTVVPARQAVPLPDGVDLELAASLGVPAITAHRCLFADGPVTGKAALVAGGAGAVGHFSIELAKWAGARVASTVSSPEKAELARAAGADLVVNYRESDVVTQLRPFAEHLDRIVEVALGANLETDLALSGPATALVVYAAGEDPVLPVRACMSANVTLRFVLLYGIPAPAIDEAVHDINVALAAGALTPLPAHRFPLDDIAAAHEAVEKGVTGKVFVVPGSQGSLSGLSAYLGPK